MRVTPLLIIVCLLFGKSVDAGEVDPRIEIKELAELAKSCTNDSQCKVIGYGYDSCGNYSNNAFGYLTYSEKTDSEILDRLLFLSKYLRDLVIKATNTLPGHSNPLNRYAAKACRADIRPMHKSRCQNSICTMGRWANEI